MKAREQFPSISVIMVSYFTGASVLERSVHSVLSQDYLKELIIIDNGNPPEVQEYLSKLSNMDRRVLVKRQPSNVGFARGCNAGADISTAQYLIFLNPDAILSNQAFTSLVSAFEEHENVWMVGCKIVDEQRRFQPTCIRNVMTPVNMVVESLGLYQYFNMEAVNFRKEPYSVITSVPAISGAFMMMPAHRYKQLHGMDEGYFLHMEDMDLCYRIHECEGRILYVPLVEVIHIGGTSQVSSEFVEWQKTKGFMRYLRLHYRYRYVPGWLVLANVGLLLRFVLKVIIKRLIQSFELTKGSS